VLDLMMPQVDGWGFRAEQIADPALAGIPVLVVSAGAWPPPPACEILSKLVEPAELIAAVARARAGGAT
jgi:CheY-like chemotaxis protein